MLTVGKIQPRFLATEAKGILKVIVGRSIRHINLKYILTIQNHRQSFNAENRNPSSRSTNNSKLILMNAQAEHVTELNFSRQ